MANKSCESLVNALVELGFPEHKLEASTFEHLFEIPELAEFFNEFTNAFETNKIAVISNNDRKHPAESKSEFEDMRDKENSDKQEYLKKLEKQAMLLRVHKQRLETIARQKAKSKQSTEEQHLKHYKENNELQNEFTRNLKKTSDFANTMASKSEESFQDLNKANPNVESSVRKYLAMENVCTESLECFMENQFYMRRLPAVEKDSICAFKDQNGVANIHKGAVRLKKCLIMTHEKLFEVEAGLHGQLLVEQWLEILLKGPVESLSDDQLSESLEKVQLETSNTNTELSDMSKILRTLSEKMAHSAVSDIVVENYELKVDRLKHVLAIQSQLLDLLLQQHSRLGFVHILLQAEVLQQREILSRLEQLTSMLEKESVESVQRTKWYEQYNVPITDNFVFVPEKDHVLQAIHVIIGQNEEELLPSFKSMKQFAKKTTNRQAEIAASLTNSLLEIEETVLELNGNVNVLKEGITGLSQETICSQNHRLKQLFSLFESEAIKLQHSVSNYSAADGEFQSEGRREKTC